MIETGFSYTTNGAFERWSEWAQRRDEAEELYNFVLLRIKELVADTESCEDEDTVDFAIRETAREIVVGVLVR